MSGKAKHRTKSLDFMPHGPTRVLPDQTVPRQFVPTPYATREDKARFCQQFAEFVKSDFSWAKFSNRLYRQLSVTFWYIAHYDKKGFWETFFTSAAGKARFVFLTLANPCYGDPTLTFSDAERRIQDWLKIEGSLERYRALAEAEREAGERTMLIRPRQKYGKA